MAEYDKSRYYWIKLTDRFMTSDTVDFLMSQKDGANYVVLYQLLCLKTVNNNGIMARQIGEMIIPYEIEKIQRDCKWFPIDTVRIALELYKKLGLIYENTEGVLAISDFDRLVGSQTIGAQKKELQKSRFLMQGGTKVENFPLEKDIDKEKEKDIDKEIYTKENIQKKVRKQVAFVPPTYEEVLSYAREKGREDIAKEFYDYFNVGDWVDSEGKKVQNWKQKFLTWCSRNKKKEKEQPKERYGDFSTKDAFEKAIEKTYSGGTK
jgi:hypothetical protein